jgi:hypothetical protein
MIVRPGMCLGCASLLYTIHGLSSAFPVRLLPHVASYGLGSFDIHTTRLFAALHAGPARYHVSARDCNQVTQNPHCARLFQKIDLCSQRLAASIRQSPLGTSMYLHPSREDGKTPLRTLSGTDYHNVALSVPR